MTKLPEAIYGDWYPSTQELIKRPLHDGLAIDPPDAHEIDDAIEVSLIGSKKAPHYYIRIHIADGGLLYGSEHVDTARSEGWTRYHDNGTTDSMLPVNIAKNVLSLDANKQTGVPAITIAFEHNPNVGIGGVQLYASRVVCDSISYATYRRRHFNHSSRARLIGAAASTIVDHTNPKHLDKVKLGEEVVGQYMIAANLIVAEAMAKQGLPWLFRNHDTEAYKNWQNDAEKDILYKLRVALYGTIALKHQGLNASPYCHFTSPLRRFADLANHLTLHASMTGKQPLYTEKDINDIATELTALYIQRSNHFKKLRAA